MKLIRLKITDPEGYRSLQSGFEYHFRKEWQWKAELDTTHDFAPFVCAGPNGSGKSNLLEALAAIFYQLEILRSRRNFLPDSFLSDAPEDMDKLDDILGKPTGFELEYLISVPKEYLAATINTPTKLAHVRAVKKPKMPIQLFWWNADEFNTSSVDSVGEKEREFLLPDYVLGYSSGENEVLSLPFFKMRFVQYDEYWQALTQQNGYSGRPDSRMIYLDNSFSQAILLCNLLFESESNLASFREDVGITALNEFRIILKRSIPIPTMATNQFGEKNPSLYENPITGDYQANLLKLLEADSNSADNFDPIITRLKRCATCWFEDEATDSLYLDYKVNQATYLAFQNSFASALELFQALQVLLTLNLYSVSEQLKSDLYQSDSLYVGETVPSLPSDERIMRIKNFWVSKSGLAEPVLLKSFSDGEHQLLHTLGLCLLFKDTNSLFLLDEPETHFNPQWRANFISRLQQSLSGSHNQEMLITTNTPFLISDSTPDKVLVFDKDQENGKVSIDKPKYNTLGASINLIAMETFKKHETIGRRANDILQHLLSSEFLSEDPHVLVKRIIDTLGDSIERSFAIQEVLSRSKEPIGSRTED
jgi:restriction system-associated AAA family ATPase